MTKILSKKTIVETYEYIDDTAVPVEPVEPAWTDQYSLEPHVVENRIPVGQVGAGNVEFPYNYRRVENGTVIWDVDYALDLSDANSGLITLKINPKKTYKDLVPICYLHFHQPVQGFKELMLTATSEVQLTPNKHLALGKLNTLSVKDRMSGMNPPLQYDISTWNPITTPETIPMTYVYLKTTEGDGTTHCSNTWYIFPPEGSKYKKL